MPQDQSRVNLAEAVGTTEDRANPETAVKGRCSRLQIHDPVAKNAEALKRTDGARQKAIVIGLSLKLAPRSEPQRGEHRGADF